MQSTESYSGAIRWAVRVAVKHPGLLVLRWRSFYTPAAVTIFTQHQVLVLQNIMLGSKGSISTLKKIVLWISPSKPSKFCPNFNISWLLFRLVMARYYKPKEIKIPLCEPPTVLPVSILVFIFSTPFHVLGQPDISLWGRMPLFPAIRKHTLPCAWMWAALLVAPFY